MNKIVTLVTAWSEFEEKYPNGSIENFCVYQLTNDKKRLNAQSKEQNDGQMELRFELTKAMTRVSKIWVAHAQTELKQLGITNFDEFVFLLLIEGKQPVRKTDIIYSQFFELSSGLLIIERLIKKGFAKETEDTKDKRSKLLSVTTVGLEKLGKGRLIISSIADNLFADMTSEDISLCVQLLTPLEKRAAQSWHETKSNSKFG